MNIALCDDDGRFRAQTARSLEEILERRGLEAEVFRFASAEELLQAQKDGKSFDVYLLDIVMPGTDGVTLARQLRKGSPTAPILFFTTSSDYAVEAFALGAAHYVVKPFSRGEFVTAIDRALALIPEQAPKGVVFKSSEGLVSVPFDELLYSESDEHYQHVHLADGREVFTRMSGLELWQRLESTRLFVRAGLRYILNLRHIQGIGKGGVTLTGGTTVEVPRRAMPEVKDAYLQFCCQ